MNSKGTISPVLLLAVFLIVSAVVVLFAFGAFSGSFPSVNLGWLSLRNIFCGGFQPVCDALNPSTWFGCIVTGFLQWACFTALPAIAGLVLAIIVVAYIVSIFPPSLGVPIALLFIGVIAFLVGFFVAAWVLDFWWLLLIIGVIAFVVKKVVDLNA
jgi:hypothetical protein